NCRISVGTAGRPQTTPGLPAPKQSETCTVPSDHRLGSNDGECVAGLRKQLADPTQNDLVDGKIRNDSRLGLPRRSTVICCRNTRILASNAARGRNRSTTIQKIILQRSNIPQRIIRFCVSRQVHGIYDRDKTALNAHLSWWKL